MADQLLDRWFQIKQEIKSLSEEEAKIKTKIGAAMAKKQISELNTERYQLTTKITSRESLSKKDCPKEIWQSHCKKTTFTTFRLTPLGKNSVELPDE